MCRDIRDLQRPSAPTPAFSETCRYPSSTMKTQGQRSLLFRDHECVHVAREHGACMTLALMSFSGLSFFVLKYEISHIFFHPSVVFLKPRRGGWRGLGLLFPLNRWVNRGGHWKGKYLSGTLAPFWYFPGRFVVGTKCYEVYRSVQHRE